jgi:glycosyltransferase involved in cell wall biosynthesis
MTSLRILHVITRLVVGGAQENTLATVAGLRTRGHDVVLATGPSNGPEGTLMERARDLGVEPVLIPQLVREPSPVRDAVALARLYRLVRRGRFDVVHTHTSKAGVLGRIAARLARTPAIVHTPHGHVFDGYFRPALTRLFVEVERILANRTDAMIAISEPCRTDHLRLGIGSPDRFVTIPSGIPGPPPGDRVTARGAMGLAGGELAIGCVGRLAPVKGQAFLLDAFARLARRPPNARLVLVGDGPCRDELHEMADRLNLDGTVRFLGLRDDASALLAGFDLYVQPSLNEGMGRALAQAMAVGVPVIATDAPGPAALVGTGGAGLLVPAGDPGALAAAIEALLHNEPRRLAAGESARKRAVGFWSEDEMVEAIEALYFRLLGELLTHARGT